MDYFESMFGPISDYFGFILSPFWVQFRIILGSFPGVGQKVNILRRRRGKGEPNGAPVEPKGGPKARQGCQKGA